MKIIELVREDTGNRNNDNYLVDSTTQIMFKAINENRETILVHLQTWYKEDPHRNNCKGFGLDPKTLDSIIAEISDKSRITNEDVNSPIRKCYSISILYSPLGLGEEYIYQAERVFKGLETNTVLTIPKNLQYLMEEGVSNTLVLEQYLIQPEKFNRTPTNPLEEWIVYLHRGYISPDTNAPGLLQALRKLRANALDDKSRDYLDYRSDMVKGNLEDKVNNLLMPLENLDKGMLTRYVKDYSKIYFEGYKKGLNRFRELGLDHSEIKAKSYADEYAKGYAKGYIRGGLLCSFEIAFRMIIMGVPYDSIIRCCKFNLEWIKELESL